jgi:hypothetical protein
MRFNVYFARLLERIDDLNRLYGGGSRKDELSLHALRFAADRVQVIERRAKFVELFSVSNWRGRRNVTPLGGMVGKATSFKIVKADITG